MSDDAEILEDLRTALLRLRFPVLLAGVLLALYALFSLIATGLSSFFLFSSGGGQGSEVAVMLALSVLGLLGTGLDMVGAVLLLASGVRGLQARVDPGHLVPMARFLKQFWWVALARVLTLLLGGCTQTILPWVLL